VNACCASRIHDVASVAASWAGDDDHFSSSSTDLMFSEDKTFYLLSPTDPGAASRTLFLVLCWVDAHQALNVGVTLD